MSPSTPPTVGVLAMQGAFARHVAMLEACGTCAVEVRTPEQLAQVDGLVIPGGESTAIRKALDRTGLLEPLRARLEGGMPAFGTCAGLIVLAHSGEDGAPATYGVLDVDVERNGFGRQVHSFEGDVRIEDGAHVTGAFIRAPRVTRVGEGVEVLGCLDGGEPVVVRQRCLLGTTFHPELTDDATLHRRFVALVTASQAPG